MDFIEDVTDMGVPEYAVTGVAGIERISIGQVRISKYSRRKDGNFILFYKVWDLQMRLATARLVEEARTTNMAEAPPTPRYATSGIALQ